MEISDRIKMRKNQITKLRRDLHQIPEVSEKEFDTCAYIKKYLSGKGYKVRQILTGLICDVAGKNNKHTVALRCDIDALPIKERTGAFYQSVNGCMHACGHDGHTAMLLTVADILAEEKPSCNVRLIFQFGEEGSGGAHVMIEKGVLNGVDEIYAIHLNPSLEKGKIATTDGAMFAGAVEFNIEFEGLSSHCAEPEKGRDVIKALNMFLSKCGQVNARHKNNSLFHVGKIEAGVARNVVASSARLYCTLRFFDFAAQEEIMMNLARLLVETDNEFKTNHRIIVEPVYSPLINSPSAVAKIKRLIPQIEDCAPKFTAEDFGAYTEKIPGCMVWLGTKDEKYFSPLHSDTFDFDETALLFGVEFFCKLIF